MEGYKRQYRELSKETKNKISQSLKGRCKSTAHKNNISQGLKEYWKNVPSHRD